jgi:hypothetical protein
MTSSRWSLTVAALFMFLAAACGDPPNKEIDQAQGAIEAAKAAGAERYAPSELKEARTALDRAQEAVRQRDYRLALNHALDSREQAQNAAKQAADQKAIVRGAAEGALATVTATLADAKTRLGEAEAARVPRPRLKGPTDRITAADAALQKARAALNREDYLGAQKTLSGVPESLNSAVTDLHRIIAAHAPRRRR